MNGPLELAAQLPAPESMQLRDRQYRARPGEAAALDRGGDAAQPAPDLVQALEMQPGGAPCPSTYTDEARQGTEGVAVRERGYARLSGEPLPPDNEMWEVADVARFLKRSVSWVYKKSAAGVLPVHRLDGWGLRYVPEEVRAWVGQKRNRVAR